jgi:hypothetical protein
MIAELCVTSGFAPEVFGVENSVEIGEEIITVLAGGARTRRAQDLLESAPWRQGRR